MTLNEAIEWGKRVASVSLPGQAIDLLLAAANALACEKCGGSGAVRVIVPRSGEWASRDCDACREWRERARGTN